MHVINLPVWMVAARQLGVARRVCDVVVATPGVLAAVSSPSGACYPLAGSKFNRSSQNVMTRSLCASALLASALLTSVAVLGAEQFATDRDLFVFCFSLPDGNFTAYQSPLMVGTDVRELKLEKDPIGLGSCDEHSRKA